MKKYGANDACIDSGLEGTEEMALLCGKSARVLRYWFNKNRTAFNCMLDGAAIKKARHEASRTV